MDESNRSALALGIIMFFGAILGLLIAIKSQPDREKQCPVCHTPPEKTTVDYQSLQDLIKKGECRGFDAKDIQKTIWVCGTNIFSELD